MIYQNGYKHVHPADLIQLQNGELLLMAREGTEHISNDGDVIMLRSKDQGKTWGDKQAIAAIKDLDEREGCGIQLKDGTIVVGIFYNNLYDADGRYKSKQVKESDQRHPTSVIDWVRTSLRRATTGTPGPSRNYIDTNGMPFTNLEGPTDAPIQMPDGPVVMGVIAYGLHGDCR